MQIQKVGAPLWKDLDYVVDHFPLSTLKRRLIITYAMYIPFPKQSERQRRWGQWFPLAPVQHKHCLAVGWHSGGWRAAAQVWWPSPRSTLPSQYSTLILPLKILGPKKKWKRTSKRYSGLSQGRFNAMFYKSQNLCCFSGNSQCSQNHLYTAEMAGYYIPGRPVHTYMHA